MAQKCCLTGWCAVLLVLLSWTLLAAENAQEVRRPTLGELPSVSWSDGVARIGNVEVDAVKREVRAPGWVNMDQGAIELLACGPRGKTHESVFVLDVNPLDLQLGFLLLGLEPGEGPTALGEGMPRGTEVDIWVEWEQDGKRYSRRGEYFVYNYETRSVLPETGWVFTGSVVEDGQFKALAEESLVATYWDPWAIVNIPLPCGADDEILSVNRKDRLPVGTRIVMRFVPRSVAGRYSWKNR